MNRHCDQKAADSGRKGLSLYSLSMAACPEGSLEDEFVRGLSGAALYFLKDGKLCIDLKYDTGTMRSSNQKKEL
ncbi:MAG TPA: hypothetical protein DDX85_08765 [Nitrospiraceae bacterium]|nr:hypothetical protein [Nitrospiraceae bacterium]